MLDEDAGSDQGGPDAALSEPASGSNGEEETNTSDPSTTTESGGSGDGESSAGGGGMGGNGGAGTTSVDAGEVSGTGGVGETTTGTGATGSSPDGGGGGQGGSPTLVNPEDLVTRFIDELGLGHTTEEWVANVTREPLNPSQVVAPAVGTSGFSPSSDYSFMFLDLVPRAGFEHATQFVFMEGDGPLVIEDQGFWPLLDGEGFVIADSDKVKLFPPVPASFPDRLPYPGEGGTDYRGASVEHPIFAIYPNLAADSGTARIYFYADAEIASATPAYVNVLVDLDADGAWEPTQGERLVTNFVLPSQSEGWTFTEEFELSTDINNKFPSHLWLRLSVSEEAVPLDEEVPENFCNSSLSYRCGDEDFDFSNWSGNDCESESDLGGCTLSFGPARENPPVPEIEGAESTFICQPDGIVISTLTKALVLNLGDNPGDSFMEHGMNKAAASLSLRYGDEGVAKLNYPTAERALEAIQELVSGLSCLDEAHIIIHGHGASGSGNIVAVNGNGSISPAELKSAITGAATHCPESLDYYSAEGCQVPGYCNLNIALASCFSGHFLTGDNTLAIPGLNVLTAASSEVVSWGDRDGVEKGMRVTHSFAQGYVNNAADAAPYGNGDGRVDAPEAQRYAVANYDQGPDNIYASDPQLSQLSDCNCSCVDPCGNGELDLDEECDFSAPPSCSIANYTCSSTCVCECGISEQDCDLTQVFDEPNCACIEACGNGVIDAIEECDPAETVSSCPLNYTCTQACGCACELVIEDCAPGTTVDAEACECVPIDHCPPNGGFSLTGQFSVFSDTAGHSCCHNVPILEDVTLSFNRAKGAFTSPGLPGQDIPALSGSMTNDSITGCSLTGSGSGIFAGFSNSSCVLQNSVILDNTFSGRVQCTPSGFPGQPIIFNFDAFMTVP